VIHLFRKVGEVEVEVELANLLDIVVDPLDLEDLSTEANDPILDILPCLFPLFGEYHLEMSISMSTRSLYSRPSIARS